MLTIIVYTFVSVFSIQLLVDQYILLNKTEISSVSPLSCVSKVQLSTVLLISVLFTLFNVYLTSVVGLFHSDRQAYLVYFESNTSTSSRGLDLIFDLIRLFSNNIVIAFYLATFFTVYCLLIAYRISCDASPAAISLIFFSTYIISTTGHLKQSYANALATLFVALAIQKSANKVRYYNWILIAIASVFHPVGFLLIPAYLLVSIPSLGRFRWHISVLFIIFILFSDRIVRLALPFVNAVSPLLAGKASQYFLGESPLLKLMSGSVLSAFLKGLPFYYVSFLGLIYRRRFLDIIQHYDKYLMISLFSSSLFLSSAFFYWMQRSVYLFFFPVYVFFTLIMSQIRRPEIRFTHWVIVGGSTVFILYRYMAQIFIFDSLAAGSFLW